MTDQRNGLAELFAACWKDEALKARFMADPVAVLAERGIEMPDGMDVTVVENTENTVHITMPMAPGGNPELSDEELKEADKVIVTYIKKYGPQKDIDPTKPIKIENE